MVRALAVALLVVVLAISGISVPRFRRSCQLANLGSVRDGLSGMLVHSSKAQISHGTLLKMILTFVNMNRIVVLVSL